MKDTVTGDFKKELNPSEKKKKVRGSIEFAKNRTGASGRLRGARTLGPGKRQPGAERKGL